MGRRGRRRAAALTLGVIGVLSCLWWGGGVPAGATPQYAADTGKECAFCHVTPGGRLTPEGVTFRENGYRLPPEPSTTTPPGGAGGPSSTTGPTTAGGGSEDSAGAGPILSLPGWLRGLMLFFHVLAAIAWLGGIISVFLVQTPQVAVSGIPRGYLRLAWPALLTVGATGVVLTLGTVTGVGMLTEGRWGRLLMAKMGIYAILALMATIATFVVSPRLQRLSETEHRRATSQEQFRAQGRITVAYQGRVYDVTGSRLWPEGRHVKRHDAWEDLTPSLSAAPHGPEVLDRFIVLEDAGDDRPPGLMRGFVGMTYFVVFLVLAVVFVVAFW